MTALNEAAALDTQRYELFPLDQYLPERVLGAGGFGAVFLCQDRYMRTEVVVKSLYNTDMDRSLEDAFAEAQILRYLSHEHPSITRVHYCSYAGAARTRPYIVMDYFPGVSLQTYLDGLGEMPMPLEDFLPIARQIADGMKAAHERGVLHRDLKPDNVLVRKNAAVWHVRIIDFGLAIKTRVVHLSTSVPLSERTPAGESVAGTARYASPEQMGEFPGVKVGPYSDVYAFGKLCSYALFRETEPKTRHWESVPKVLAQVLEKCTERRVEQRCLSFEPVLAVFGALARSMPLRREGEAPGQFIESAQGTSNRAQAQPTQVMPMTDKINTHEAADELHAFRGSVALLQTRLPPILERAANPRLEEGWPGLRTRLDRLRGEAEKPAQMTVALLGTMGSGKSTLINTLVGAEVLATKDSVEACTAVPCELSWGPGSRYRAEVLYLSQEEWAAERARLIGNLESTRGQTDEESVEIREEARKTLQAVYGLPVGVKADEIDPVNLPQLDQVLAELRARPPFEDEDLEKLRKQLSPFLTTEAARWPLVSRVRIVGPFPKLPADVTLVDLPGTNDPNQAREAVTRRYLNQATNVWVVFNVRRGLSRDILRGGLLLNLLLTGSMDRLGFIATNSDCLNFDDGPPDSILRDKANETRKKTREVIADVLTGQGAPQDVGIEHFFLTSARDYDWLSRSIRKRSGPVLETLEQTGIPALRDHLKRLGQDFGLGKQLMDLRERLAQLLHEGKQEAELERVRISQQMELSSAQRQAVDQAVARAVACLEADLNQAHCTFADDLGRSRQQLLIQVREGIRLGRGELQNTELRWKSLAWNTLGAICRGGGNYASKAGKHDFPAQLIKPVFETVAQVWDEFFGRAFTDRLTHFKQGVQGRVQEFGAAMMEIVRQQSREASSLPEALAQFQATTEKALAEALHQAQEQATTMARHARADLVEAIQDLIKKSMAPAFVEAGAERGHGAKDRILAHLCLAARECTHGAYDRVQQAAESATNKLHEQVIGRYQELVAAILRQAGRAREQLTQAVATGRQGELLATRNRLDTAIKELVALAKEVGINLA